MLKRFLTSVAVLAVAISATAQRPAAPVQHASPIVNPDNTVTFNLSAPNAKSVKVNAQFAPKTDMVKGEDGKLQRRTVQTGKMIWSSYTMIRGGLTLEDRVAFPYGKDVVEGAKTVDAEANDFYNSY